MGVKFCPKCHSKDIDVAMPRGARAGFPLKCKRCGYIGTMPETESGLPDKHIPKWPKNF